MESYVDGGHCSETNQNSTSILSKSSSSTTVTIRPSRPPSPKQARYEGSSSAYRSGIHNHDMKIVHQPNGFLINSKHPNKMAYDHTQHGELPNMARHFYSSHKGKSEFSGQSEVLDGLDQTFPDKKVNIAATKMCIKDLLDDSKSSDSSDLIESESTVSGSCEGDVGQLQGHIPSQSAMYSPSPNSVYTATLYTEAKQSFTNTEVSEEASTVEKSGYSGEATNSYENESRKTSMYRGSTDSNVSDESSCSSFNSAGYKPHKANDIRWEAIQKVRSRVGALGIKNFRVIQRLGCGDIGSVHLSELIGTGTYFAIKVMDKAMLASRKKLPRAQTEREILQCLDHPFLPTLYTHFETERMSCLVMEFCPGGDLHTLRQRQPGKCFSENAARFYVAEVLLALEYLHMLGIIYRDLKPENVLVREDGHIMLSDFDLSLRCVVSPTLVKSSNASLESKNSGFCIEPSCVMQPDCIQPACFTPRFMSGKPKPKKDRKGKPKNEINYQARPLPELIAEPTSARSMSFVGTHEYLAPEIIKGEGHGSAVDWWTFGIFLYELLFGRTPFKGQENRATLFNVVGQPLRFPESPTVSFAARDLIRGLLVKEPQHRLAYRRGATEIKQHPFFQNVNWALIRCTNPPEVPRQVRNFPEVLKQARIPPGLLKQAGTDFPMRPDMPKGPTTLNGPELDVKPSDNYFEIEFF